MRLFVCLPASWKVIKKIGIVVCFFQGWVWVQEAVEWNNNKNKIIRMYSLYNPDHRYPFDCLSQLFASLICYLCFWCDAGSLKRASGTSWQVSLSMIDRAPWPAFCWPAKVSVNRWSVTTWAISSGRSTWKYWGITIIFGSYFGS